MNIITKIKNIDFVREVISIVPYEKANSFLYDRKWLPSRIDTGTFFLRIDRNYYLDWSYNKISKDILKILNETGHSDVEVDNDTFLFILKGLWKQK